MGFMDINWQGFNDYSKKKKQDEYTWNLGKYLGTVKNLWDFGLKCMDIRKVFRIVNFFWDSGQKCMDIIRKVLGTIINIQGWADGNMWTLGRFNGS